MKYKKLISFLAFFLAVLSVYGQNPFILKSGEPVTIACGNSEEEVVHTALNLLNRDVESVFSTRIIVTPESKKGMIIVGTIGQSDLIAKAGVDLSPIKNKKEAFLLTVSSTGKLVIAGSDKRGTAYGVMELSRLIGVSPWEWWADATPAKKEIFQLPASYRNMQSPSVEYRGIFINDEDWGLTPWSWQTYEPSDVKGQIGPKTHERIFELLLRLRANTFWPAMHGCSVPFYFTPGNKEVADKFGIFIGTSHCEPMMRNTNGEWKRDGVGEYDYVHNSAHVLSFWEQRVKEVAELDNLYTLGMRGVHDGAMNGAKTIEEQKAVLTKVLKDQRDLLTKYVNKDVTQVPQVFIPYKEVLDVYHAGLQVPDEVTLMWCDDNYGYIRHFPTAEERARKGGNGVYYHISYWGRPHDYLWLGTVHPSLVYQQMSLAYERGIQKMWILNVGDIKPAEYQVELFLDMAWNLEAVKQQGVAAHQRHFLEREFGKNRADRLQPVMQEAYRLAYIRKPEFMGNTRTEEKDPKFKVISDLPWSEQEINERLAAYRQLSDKVEQEWHALPAQKKETYFQLVKYPVQAAAQMNEKCGNGIDQLDEVVETKEVKEKILYIEVAYTNTSDQQTGDTMFQCGLLWAKETGDGYETVDVYAKDDVDYDSYYGQNYRISNVPLYYYNGKSAEEKNHLIRVQPGETRTVTLAFLVTEDELPYLYLDLFSGNDDYTQFRQSALLYGYVDIRQ